MTDHRHRALLLARHIEDGDRLFSYLTSRQSRDAMLKAVDDGVPPLSRLSTGMAERFPAAARTLPARQMAGLAVLAVLSDEGCEVERAQVRLRGDPLFAVAALFRRSLVPAPPGCEWIERLVGMMSDEEAGYAKALLEARRGKAP